MKNLKIPQATGKGYIEVEPYGAFDWTYPNSRTRRGRVQMGGILAPPFFARTKFMCMKRRTDMKILYKGKEITPYESFYCNTTQSFFHGELGGGISRCVKTDDSLAVMVEYKTKQTIDVNEESNSFQPIR